MKDKIRNNIILSIERLGELKLSPDQIKNCTLYEIGFDSIRMVVLQYGIQGDYGVELPLSLFFEDNIGTLLDHVLDIIQDSQD